MFVFQAVDRDKYLETYNWMKDNQDVTVVDDPELNYAVPSEKFNWNVVCYDTNRSTDKWGFDYKYPVAIGAATNANRRTAMKPMLISNEFKNMDIERGIISAIEQLMKNDGIKKYTTHFNDEYNSEKCLDIYGEDKIYRNDKSGLHFNIIIDELINYHCPEWFKFNL